MTDFSSKRLKLVELGAIWNTYHPSVWEFHTRPSRKVMQQWYSNRIHHLNAVINQLEQEVGLSSACYKGCAWCCYHPILITPFESVVIREFLDQQRLWNLYRSKIMNVKRKIHANYLTTRVLRTHPTRDAAFEKYLKLQISCPFVTENSECAVYPVRPLACAFYKNYGLVDNCQKPFVETLGIPDSWIERIYQEINTIGTNYRIDYCLTFSFEHLSIALLKI
jgi:Fe-S-cluster containining protein